MDYSDLSERSDKAYERWSAAASQFDYYIAALLATVVAYLLSQQKPTPPAGAADIATLAAIVAFVAALALSILRLEAMVTSMGLGHIRLSAKMKHAYFQESASPSTQITEEGTGKTFTQQQVLDSFWAQAKAAKKAEDEWGDKAAVRYRWRNRFLLGGIGLYLVGYVWRMCEAA